MLFVGANNCCSGDGEAVTLFICFFPFIESFSMNGTVFLFPLSFLQGIHLFPPFPLV